MKSFVLIAAVWAAGCGHCEPRGRQDGDRPQILADDLRAAVARPDEAMTSPRAALALDNGTAVRSCADYLRARRAGAGVAETVEARLAASGYVLCDALEAVRCATEGRGSPAAAQAGQELATRLDLRQLRTSFGPRLDEATHTLAAMGGPLHLSGTAADLTTDDWTFALHLAAVADVDGDGRADWVVWLADEARTGSYRDYQTVIVFDPGKPGSLRTVTWPPPGSARVCPR